MKKLLKDFSEQHVAFRLKWIFGFTMGGTCLIAMFFGVRIQVELAGVIGALQYLLVRSDCKNYMVKKNGNH